MEYIISFIVGGIICAVGQVLIDLTKLTPARILVIYVTTGTILTFLGIYDKIVDFAGCGATVPIIGFGYSLAKGVIKSMGEKGFLGIFTGGITATAGGVAAAIFFGFIFSLIFTSKDKK